jgi:hypothetical protein
LHAGDGARQSTAPAADQSPMTRDQARAEIAAMMKPGHPMHEEYRWNSPKAREYIAQLYARVNVPTPEVAQAAADAAVVAGIDTDLRGRWGAEHDAVKARVQAVTGHLFADVGGIDGRAFEAMDRTSSATWSIIPRPARSHVLVAELLRDLGGLGRVASRHGRARAG